MMQKYWSGPLLKNQRLKEQTKKKEQKMYDKLMVFIASQRTRKKQNSKKNRLKKDRTKKNRQNNRKKDRTKKNRRKNRGKDRTKKSKKKKNRKRKNSKKMNLVQKTLQRPSTVQVLTSAQSLDPLKLGIQMIVLRMLNVQQIQLGKYSRQTWNQIIRALGTRKNQNHHKHAAYGEKYIPILKLQNLNSGKTTAMK